MNPRAPRVCVTIDRLVLRGFPAEQRDALAASLHAELRRQFGDAVTLQSIGASRSIASLGSNPVKVTAAGGPRGIGVQAAQSLMRSLRS